MLARLWDSTVTATLMAAMCGVVFAIMEGIWPARAAQKRLRPQILLDVGYLYAGVFLLTVLDLTWIGALADVAKRTPAGAAMSATSAFLRRIPAPLEMAIALVVADLTGYWKHRLFHTRLLWPFHAVHHSSEEVDWLSNERNHPVESVFTNVFQLAPLVFLGFRPEAIAFAAVLRRTHSVYEHTNLSFSYGWLSYVFVSPRFHRWHHASDDDVVDKNYANVFSFWDLIFGTFRLPERATPRSYGIEGYPRGFVGQVIQPFRDLASGAWRRRTTQPH